MTISASTSFAHDFYTNVIHRGTERKPGEEVKVARVTAFVVGAIAMAIAILLGPNANVAFLVADWTNQGSVIAKALAEHGRAGVPLYLVYPASGGQPVVLPQVLTPGLVAKAVSDAAAGQRDAGSL